MAFAKVPIEIMGHMQQIYQRALCQLGPDVGCYAPPKLLEVRIMLIVHDILDIEPGVGILLSGTSKADVKTEI